MTFETEKSDKSTSFQFQPHVPNTTQTSPNMELPCSSSSTTSQLSGQVDPCPAAADALIAPAVKRESIMDRMDMIIAGTIIAFSIDYLLSLWPYAQNFKHSDGIFLFTYTWSFPIVSMCLYMIMVHVIGPILRAQTPPELAKNPPPFFFRNATIKAALKYWNLFLAILSYCMLLGMGIPLIKFWYTYGFREAVCDYMVLRAGGPSFLWMWVFTMSKYVELFDTAFMVIRRRPVSLLHWYHHMSVLAYTWFAVVIGFTPGWYFATINSGVHTIMYFYYYRSACGVRLTYDRLITTLQLTQMVVGVAVTACWAYFHFSANGDTVCPCAHGDLAMLSAIVIYGSYFLLFLSFYLQRYVNKSAKVKSL